MRTVRCFPLTEVRRLSNIRSEMPEVIRTDWERRGGEPVNNHTLIEITSLDISNMDEAFGWLWWIEPTRTRSIVMCRAAGARWRRIGWHHGLGERRCRQLNRAGLDTITARLIDDGYKMLLTGFLHCP